MKMAMYVEIAIKSAQMIIIVKKIFSIGWLN